MLLLCAIPLLVYGVSTIAIEALERGLLNVRRPWRALQPEMRTTWCVLLAQAISNAVASRIFVRAQPHAKDILIGMAIVDTAEYWCHRAMHRSVWAYRHMHRTHHAVSPQPAYALLNSSLESMSTGLVVGVGVWTFGVSWESFIVVMCLASAKTVWDHSAFSKGHALHHQHPQYNFEQPFCHLWDHAMGTFKKVPPHATQTKPERHSKR